MTPTKIVASLIDTLTTINELFKVITNNITLTVMLITTIPINVILSTANIITVPINIKHYDHKYYRSGKKHGYNYQPYAPGYYSHRNTYHYSRQSHFVDDYFTILGGTIVINELLYHSHEHR